MTDFWKSLQEAEDRRKAKKPTEQPRTFRQIEEEANREVRQIILARDLNAAEQQEDGE